MYDWVVGVVTDINAEVSLRHGWLHHVQRMEKMLLTHTPEGLVSVRSGGVGEHIMIK